MSITKRNAAIVSHFTKMYQPFSERLKKTKETSVSVTDLWAED